MEYRRLGRSGVKVSEVGLGSWLTFGGSVDEAESRTIVHRALDLGINFVDTADVYSGGRAEEVLGDVLEDLPRKDVVLASKCYFPTGEGPNDRGLNDRGLRDWRRNRYLPSMTRNRRPGRGLPPALGFPSIARSFGASPCGAKAAGSSAKPGSGCPASSGIGAA